MATRWETISTGWKYKNEGQGSAQRRSLPVFVYGSLPRLRLQRGEDFVRDGQIIQADQRRGRVFMAVTRSIFGRLETLSSTALITVSFTVPG